MDMDDMVRMMMGGGGGMPGGMGGMGGGARRQRKGKDVGIAFPVSLEDLYSGKTASVPRDKVILCPQCKGTGSSKPGQSATCGQCRGQGARVMMRQIGPGMMQQMQVPCEACNGRGSALKDADKCKSCFGSCTKQVEQPLTVRIEPGMEHDDQIPFMGEGDQSPDYDIPGAIVVVLRQLKHDTFTRDGNNLHIKQKITLAEALCGTVLTFKHLDGREVHIDISAADGIKPGVEKCVKSMGMPIAKASGSPTRGAGAKYGDLVIKFDVTFPESMSEESIAALRKVLPPPANQAASIPDDHEECYMTKAALDEMRKEMEKEAEDDDDEDGQGGVRCAQQ